MIDFPASPTDGQIFSAPNGVAYKYSTTYSSWLAQAGPPVIGGTGEVTAYASTLYTPVNATAVVLVFQTVIGGNAGSWLNTSNGRYTPPAGKYFIQCSYTTQAPPASNGTWTLQARKNGVNIPAYEYGSGSASFSIGLTVGAYVDANGTDYFEFTGTAQVVGMVGQAGHFAAFPLTGIQGPSGQIGWRQLGRVVPSAAQANVDFINIPTDINDLKFTFDVTPTTNAQDLVLQFYDNTGTLDNTAVHYASAITQASNTQTGGTAPVVYGNITTAITNSIPLNLSATNLRVGNVSGIRGSGTIPDIQAVRPKGVDFQSNYLDDAATALRICTGGGWRNISTAITGLRFLWGSSTFAAGGAVTVWGSP
jgi:hypothetical protein